MAAKKIRISLDGGEIIEVNDVMIEVPEGDDDDCTCTLKFNHEGMVQDLWDKSPDQVCLHTGCMPWEEFLPTVEQF